MGGEREGNGRRGFKVLEKHFVGERSKVRV